MQSDVTVRSSRLVYSAALRLPCCAVPCLRTTGTALSTVVVIGSVVNRQLKKHCAERNSQLSYGSVIVTVTASNIVGLTFVEIL